MLSVIASNDAPPKRLKERGYCVVYRENQVNHCPGCGRTHWFVGRISAECGFCSTALPLAEASSRGIGTHVRNYRPIFLAADAA